MNPDRMCDNLLIGVCGSIHALDVHTYLPRFRESLASNIKVMVTRSARQMINENALALYADDRVFGGLWDRSRSVDRAAHIQLTRWADLFLIVPATANILGKGANGIADDLISTAILAYNRTVIFAPAMNPVMWQSPVVQRNVQTLREDGHLVVPPEPATSVTSGEWDLGLAPSPETLLAELQHVRMTALKNEYWEEATREKPLTPAQKKLRSLLSAFETRAGDAGE